eukprot:TRINITY_DN5657_c0_g2_i8.p1 TRINITY_DN5657_c0_g2~~TRINITY_DN5657_c0_g2_i8.p1  ORF type:complete len:217 (-),score=10.28 TRINITY_DN5657_c0_g2_i8:92-742(-)
MNFEPELECWKGSHLLFGMLTFGLSFFGWGVAFHGFLLRNLTKKKHIIHALMDYTWKDGNNIEKPQEDTKTEEMMSFLWISYNKNGYFWEFVIIARKVIMILVSVITINLSYKWRTVLVLLVILAMIRMQIGWQPYATKAFNNLEITSLLIIYVSANLGLLMDAISDDYVKSAFSTVIVILNSIYGAICICYLLISLYRTRKSGNAKDATEAKKHN